MWSFFAGDRVLGWGVGTEKMNSGELCARHQRFSTTNVRAVIFASEIPVQLLWGSIQLASVAADPQQFNSIQAVCFFLSWCVLLFWDL